MKTLLPASVKVVAIDTETAGGTYPDEGARVASVSIAWAHGSRSFNFAHPGQRSRVGYLRLLEELASRQLIFHNASYDLVMLEAGTPECAGVDLTKNLLWCTMLASRILHPIDDADLNSVAQRYGLEGKQGLDALQGWLKEHKFKKYEYAQAPWVLVEPYVSGDAEQTFAVWEHQESDSTNEQSRVEIEREIDLCKVLTTLEMRGVCYDAKQSRAIATQLTLRADEQEARMPFKCSINVAKAFFFDECKLVADRHSEKTGAPSLDKEQIRDWAEVGIPWAQEYKEVMWARRAVSRWYSGYPEKIGRDGRLRVRYSQGSVVSGRLSAKRINLQAMPLGDKIEADVPGPRELLRAKRGHQLWQLDMSQAELRIAAVYAKCQRMIDMLEAGADYHADTTKNVMHYDESHPEWKEKRVIGKKLNFGSLYGIGGETFMRLLSREAGIHLSLEECTKIVWAWRDYWWEFTRAAQKANKVFENRGWVKILMGSEHETVSYKQPEDFPNSGWNRMVQGSLAGWMRLWLVEIERDHPGTLVLTVHDSAILELPSRTAKTIAAEIAHAAEVRATPIFGIRMPVDMERVA